MSHVTLLYMTGMPQTLCLVTMPRNPRPADSGWMSTCRGEGRGDFNGTSRNRVTTLYVVTLSNRTLSSAARAASFSESVLMNHCLLARSTTGCLVRQSYG